MVTQVYKIRSEVWVAPSPSRNLATPKKSKFWRDLAQLCNLIENISNMQQDIVNWKMALQTTDTPTQANLIWCTLVHKWQKMDQSYDLPNFQLSDWSLPRI